MKRCEWVSDVFVVSLTRKDGLKFFKIIQQVENQLIRLSQNCYHAQIHRVLNIHFALNVQQKIMDFKRLFLKKI